MNQSDIVIIGAGLSGLATALLLHEAGKSFCILESSAHIGGRIRSVLDNNTGNHLADLGPTWVWPAYQPVVREWLKRLKLETFPQFDDGNTILDYGPNSAPQIGFVPGQDGNQRIVGGPQALIDAIRSRLPEKHLYLETSAIKIETNAECMVVHTNKNTVKCSRVVVAVPPRIACGRIKWDPDLPEELSRILCDTPTWMAPHAKVAILYENAFWRDAGLSGRVLSRFGPIVECHDHCSQDGETAALWGFIGWTHEKRRELKYELEEQIYTQLRRCFGSSAQEPKSIIIEDWSQNCNITFPTDLSGPMSHPSVRPDLVRIGHDSGRLWFTGAETAQQSPGLIEGALDSANRVVESMLND